MAGVVRIGTSGWHYKHWLGQFYPAKLATKLKDPALSTVRFFDGAERLGEKLGPILFQLPPRWRADVERLSNFFEALPEEHRYVIEIRDESWLVKEVYDVLREFNVAFCIHDLANMQTPLNVTADFTYIRFHGPGAAKYRGSYSDSALEEWAERISQWRNSNVGSYVYFNNDIGGHAITNAQTLKQLLRD